MTTIVYGTAVYISQNKDTVNCMVLLNNETMPFTAREKDPSTQEVWDKLISGEAGEIAPFVQPPPPDYSAQNKAQAAALLSATDWVELGDVSDTNRNPHLVNKEDFSAYREQVRAIAVAPPTTPASFPEVPTEQWSFTNGDE
jgi:hypothetical protein